MKKLPKDIYTTTLQHLRTSARTPLRLAPVGGATEVDSSTTEVAARAAESSSTLGVDDGTAGVTSVGNLGGGRRVWWGPLGESTVAEAALATGTAVDGLSTPRGSGSGRGSKGSAAFSRRLKEDEEVEVEEEDGAPTAQLDPAPEKVLWQVLASQ
ncbi:MAG: hypothetical protein Q9209_001769 [Squamulea sp. 1 TL-2023]